MLIKRIGIKGGNNNKKYDFNIQKDWRRSLCLLWLIAWENKGKRKAKWYNKKIRMEIKIIRIP